MVPRAIILVIQDSPGTPSRRPWGPDLDFDGFGMDFGTVLGLSLGHVGYFVMVWGTQVADRVPGKVF